MKFGTLAFDAAREQASRIKAQRIWVSLIWLVGLLITMQGLRAGITGGITSSDLDAIATGARTGSPVAEALYQAARMGIICVSIFAVLTYAPIYFARPKEMRWFWLGAALTTFSLVVSCIAGIQPTLSVQLFELPLLLLALWSAPVPPLAVVAKHVRGVLLAIIYASLALFAVSPALVSQPYYGGLVSMLPFRLNGVTAHANILGGLVATYLVMEFMPRTRAGLGVWVHRFAALAALVLCQSKTTIGMLLAVVMVSVVFGSSWQRRGRFLRLVVGGVGLVAGLRVALAPGNPLANDLESGSFTGRDAIWRETLNVWAKEPLFGYGPNLWNLDMRIEYQGYLPNPPAHAHSQVIQVLGMYGVLGMAAFAVLLIGFLVAARAGYKVSHGATVAFALLLIGRSITEPVWFLESLTNTAPTMLGVLVVIAGAAAVSCRPSEQVTEAKSPSVPARRYARESPS